jgi:hypothetical protein
VEVTRGLIVALFCAYVPLAAAQPAATEWSSTEKIVKGNCGEGAIAHVVESAGSLHIKIFIDDKQAADFNVPLASDGSGKAEFAGATGRNIMEVSAGTGKRPMKNARMDGACQWSWSPQ